MLKLRTYHVLLCLTLTLMACGNTASPQPINAQNPMYVLLARDQQMVLAVINRPAYTLAGTLPIVNVNDTPPVGNVGIMPDGSIVVTYGGSFMNGKEVVKADTLVCIPKQGQCSSIIDGWGGAIVMAIGPELAVPLWHDTDPFRGQLVILTGSPIKINQRISLNNMPLGNIYVAPDERSLYWLVPPGGPSGSSTYHLIRFDLATRTITATYDFGASVPGGLAIAANGTVYTTILYAQQGDKIQGTPSTNEPGNQIFIFTPDLHKQGQFSVGAEPFQIALSSGTMAVTYGPDQSKRVDVFSQSDFSLLHSLTSPYPTPIDNLSVLSTGEFAVTVNTDSIHLGIWAPTSSQIEWHTYQGISIGGIAG